MGKTKGIEFGNFTSVGRVREKNEDYYGSFEFHHGRLFVVCDGMGGHKGGQRASQLAVEEIRDYVNATVEIEPTVFLQKAIENANRRVFEEARVSEELKGMGTTCVILYIKEGPKPLGWIAHVGDSRVYRIRRGRNSRMTKDHSKVQKMIDMGIISLKEAANHPQKNVITRAIGIDEHVYPEVREIDLCRNDRYILCTDGITDQITDEDIERYTRKESDPQQMASVLVSLADERGGFDNATIQVVDITRGKTPPREAPAKKPRQELLAIVAVVGLLVLAYLVLWPKPKEIPPSVADAVVEQDSAVVDEGANPVISDEGADPKPALSNEESFLDSVPALNEFAVVEDSIPEPGEEFTGETEADFSPI